MTARPDNDHLTRQLDAINAKIELLKGLAVESDCGVIVENSTALEPIPGLPRGVIETFGLFRRLEGSCFRFARPDVISSRESWVSRGIDPYCPLGNPLSIGCELHEMPADLRDTVGGEPIYLDTEDGDVYHLTSDDYVFLYKHPDEEVELHVFAPDLATFVNEFVLGARYPELVDTVLGPGVRQRRLRKGPDRGQYADSWLRLLVRAGLAT